MRTYTRDTSQVRSTHLDIRRQSNSKGASLLVAAPWSDSFGTMTALVTDPPVASSVPGGAPWYLPQPFSR